MSEDVVIRIPAEMIEQRTVGRGDVMYLTVEELLEEAKRKGSAIYGYVQITKTKKILVKLKKADVLRFLRHSCAYNDVTLARVENGGFIVIS